MHGMWRNKRLFLILSRACAQALIAAEICRALCYTSFSMAYSSFANHERNPEEGDSGNNSPDYQRLLQHYRLLIETSPLPEEKKQVCRDWVKTNPPEQELSYAIAEWHDSVKSHNLEKQYESFARDFEKKGIISNAREWIEWFQKEKIGDKERYVKQLMDSLADPEKTSVQNNSLGERYKFYKILRKLPRTEREKLKNSLGSESFDTSKQKIEAAFEKHQKLKAIFLGLPKEMQAKYKDTFKSMTLDEREKFLKSMAVLSPEAMKKGGEKNNEDFEKKEKAEMIRKFDADMEKALHHWEEGGEKVGNIFSPLSRELYRSWAEAQAQKLSSLQLKELLGKNKNEFYIKMKDRINARRLWDREVAPKLPKEMRAELDRKFFMADLEKRKAFIAQYGSPQKGFESRGRAISYMPAVLERYIAEALAHPSLKQSRLLLSFAQLSFTWRRRAEIMYKTTEDTDTLSKKAEEAGRKVDETHEFNIEQLTHHGEVRHQYLKEVVRPGIGKGQNAMAPNLRLLNEQKREVSAQEFDKQIKSHQEEEVIAGVINKVSERLPGASRESIKRAIKPSRLILSDHHLITMAA